MSGIPSAIILGCAGAELAPDEAALFRALDPFGFILFARNVRDPQQVATLVSALREAVGRADAPVLIDQEGGRVARLKPPHWPALPPLASVGALWAGRRSDALMAAQEHATALAAMLRPLGIAVPCTPVLDVPVPEADGVIGDRAFAADPQTVRALGLAYADALGEYGCIAIAKHIPGHGRATVDSHKALPIVTTPLTELEASDFVPFRAIWPRLPWAMVAHVVYTALDPERPASTSPKAIDYLRRRLAFRGLLIADDIGMEALRGSLPERAAATLEAGCDLTLHCSGDLAEMEAIAPALRPMWRESLALWDSTLIMREQPPPAPGALAAALGALDRLLA